jgi:hypothetical protein
MKQNINLVLFSFFFFCTIVRFQPGIPYHMRFLKFYLDTWQAFLNGRNCHLKVSVFIRQSKTTSLLQIHVRRREIQTYFRSLITAFTFCTYS